MPTFTSFPACCASTTSDVPTIPASPARNDRRCMTPPPSGRVGHRDSRVPGEERQGTIAGAMPLPHRHSSTQVLPASAERGFDLRDGMNLPKRAPCFVNLFGVFLIEHQPAADSDLRRC